MTTDRAETTREKIEEYWIIKDTIRMLTKKLRPIEEDILTELGMGPGEEFAVEDYIVNYGKPQVREYLNKNRLQILARDRFGAKGERLIRDATDYREAKPAFKVTPRRRR